MSVREELRRRRLDEADLDAEQEVDVREAWGKIARRWWLPAAGLALGIAIGFLLSLGGGKVYRAEAVIYLGQPFSPGGTAPVPTLATNPETVGEEVRSEAALLFASRASGIPVSALRGNISTQVVGQANLRRAPTQTPLYEIGVEGDGPGRVARAANALAQRVINRISAYPNTKIRGYSNRLAAIEEALDSVRTRITELNAAISQERNLSLGERLVLVSQLDDAEQRRASLIADQSANQQLLALALNAERASVLEPAVARQTTARSVRNSALVGGLIGLILGTLAALVADRFSGRAGRRLA